MTPFQDWLREKQHKGPLKMSPQWPPPAGTDFVEQRTVEEIGVAVVHRGRLLVPNDQGVPTWTCANVVQPYHDIVNLALTYYGAQLQGGSRILMYCECRGMEFVAVEANDGMDLTSFLSDRSHVGNNVGDETERRDSIAYEMVRQVLNIHEVGVYHRDLGMHSILVENRDGKKTYGPGDVHLVGYERAGTVSDRFRNEKLGLHVDGPRYRNEMSSALEGDERLLRTKPRNVLNPLPRNDDPLTSVYMSLDSFLGQEKPAGALGYVNEKLVERYHLAQTVFRLFGGDVDGPKPDSMPQDLHHFLVGLSTKDISKRFHSEARLKNHGWMKRRAAIAAAVRSEEEGWRADNVEPCHVGEAMRTIWTPVLKKTARDTRNAGGLSDPLDFLAQIVQGAAGGAGAGGAAVVVQGAVGARGAAVADQRAGRLGAGGAAVAVQGAGGLGAGGAAVAAAGAAAAAAVEVEAVGEANPGPAIEVHEPPPGSPPPRSGSSTCSDSEALLESRSDPGSTLSILSRWADAGDCETADSEGNDHRSPLASFGGGESDSEWEGAICGEGSGKEAGAASPEPVSEVQESAPGSPPPRSGSSICSDWEASELGWGSGSDPGSRLSMLSRWADARDGERTESEDFDHCSPLASGGSGSDSDSEGESSGESEREGGRNGGGSGKEAEEAGEAGPGPAMEVHVSPPGSPPLRLGPSLYLDSEASSESGSGSDPGSSLSMLSTWADAGDGETTESEDFDHCSPLAFGGSESESVGEGESAGESEGESGRNEEGSGKEAEAEREASPGTAIEVRESPPGSPPPRLESSMYSNSEASSQSGSGSGSRQSRLSRWADAGDRETTESEGSAHHFPLASFGGGESDGDSEGGSESESLSESVGGSERLSESEGEGRRNGEGKGKGKGKRESEQMTVDGRRRATPLRSTAAAAGLSDSEEGDAGSASADGAGSCKRKRLESGGDICDGADAGKSPKRGRRSPRSDGGSPSGGEQAAPAAANFPFMVKPFMRLNAVKLYWPFDPNSVAGFERDDLEWDGSGGGNHEVYGNGGGSSSGGGGGGGGVGGSNLGSSGDARYDSGG